MLLADVAVEHLRAIIDAKVRGTTYCRNRVSLCMAWMEEATEVICEKKVPMVHGAATWTTSKTEENLLRKTDMITLWRVQGVTIRKHNG